MPSSAAALVTSPSLAAPSSIEYSVCTCRCTKFSAADDRGAGLLTVRGAPHGSCSRLPTRGGQGRRVVLGDRRGRPFEGVAGSPDGRGPVPRSSHLRRCTRRV